MLKAIIEDLKRRRKKKKKKDEQQNPLKAAFSEQQKT